MAYAFSFWTCYLLYKEYDIVASMRLHFLASERRRPDQFTVSLIVVVIIISLQQDDYHHLFFFLNTEMVMVNGKFKQQVEFHKYDAT